jgi:EAL and modified HD-GYP domain-containing signal transduction protein
VTDLGQDRCPELTTVSLLRATMCERLAKLAGLPRQASNLFLVGLFSALDALLGRPLDQLLDQLAVPETVRAALLGEPGPLGDVFALVLAYERAEWDEVSARSASLGIDENALPWLYTRSAEWVAQVTKPG